MKKKLFIFIVVNALFSVPALAQEGLITINKSAEIERILALKKEMNKKMPFIKIQIYSGNRLGAKNALTSFESDFPEQFVEMKYETPNYKVWVGKFRTRIKADRELVKVKILFPNAFLFTP